MASCGCTPEVVRILETMRVDPNRSTCDQLQGLIPTLLAKHRQVVCGMPVDGLLQIGDEKRDPVAIAKAIENTLDWIQEYCKAERANQGFHVFEPTRRRRICGNTCNDWHHS